MKLHILFEFTDTDYEVMINMEPISTGTDDAFGVRILPAIFMRSSGDASLSNLTQSEREAVDRVKDQFHNDAELRDFIKGLRS